MNSKKKIWDHSSVVECQALDSTLSATKKESSCARKYGKACSVRVVHSAQHTKCPAGHTGVGKTVPGHRKTARPWGQSEVCREGALPGGVLRPEEPRRRWKAAGERVEGNPEADMGWLQRGQAQEAGMVVPLPVILGQGRHPKWDSFSIQRLKPKMSPNSCRNTFP